MSDTNKFKEALQKLNLSHPAYQGHLSGRGHQPRCSISHARIAKVLIDHPSVHCVEVGVYEGHPPKRFYNLALVQDACKLAGIDFEKIKGWVGY